MTRTFTIERPCFGCGGVEMTIGRSANIAGQEVFPWVCVKCGEVHRTYAKREVAERLERETGRPLPSVTLKSHRDPQKLVLRRQDRESRRCEVCDGFPVQRHHWAPFYLFGIESEQWPQSYLCQACHTRWHQIVTPRMSEPRGHD